MNYSSAERYEKMIYRRCGNTGLMLPLISLGFWHNFGADANIGEMRKTVYSAFDNGITHFDLANNYGPPPGSAEEHFGAILKDFPYRDEIVIATKAGYKMWEGPYGDFGSRKYMLASLDQSLKRMGLSYVDIFYHHRPDPNTALEESMLALDTAIKQGKALYAGISNYNASQTRKAIEVLHELKTPFVLNQCKYSMLKREIEEDGVLSELEQGGAGFIAFSPLAQGLLTGKYLKTIPADSRISSESIFLNKEDLTPELHDKLSRLNSVAMERGQSLTQMALSWVLKDERVTSVIVGARNAAQLSENIGAIKNVEFSDEEIELIDEILA